MAIGNINKSVCEEQGETNALHCPACGKEVRLQLFATDDKSLFSTLMKKSSALTFAVCPECSAVFNVNESYLEARESGTTVFLEEKDLTPLKRS